MKMDHHTHNNMTSGESTPLEFIKLGGLLIGIGLTAYWLHAGGLQNYLQWFMGVFFLVFASFKFIGYEMFVPMFSGYDVVAKRYKQYGYAFPFIELGLAVLYLFNLLPVFREVLTIIILGIGTIGVFQEIKKRSGIHCACLGNIIKLPLSTVSLVEDVGMGLMAFVMLLL